MRGLAMLLVIGLVIAWAVPWRNNAPPRLASHSPPNTSSRAAPSGQLDELLATSNYAAAAMRLRLRCRTNTARWDRCRKQLLEYTIPRVGERGSKPLVQLLNLLLEYVPDDAPARLLKARILRSQGELEQALELLGALRNQALRNDAALAPYGDLEAEFTNTANQQLAELQQGKQWPAVKALLRELSILDPGNGEWFYRLATTQLQLGDRSDARDSLNRIYYHPQWGERAQALERKQFGTEEGEEEEAVSEAKTVVEDSNREHSNEYSDEYSWGQPIPLKRHGRHFLVELDFGGIKLPFLIDTGASLTVIDGAVLQRTHMSYSDRGITYLQTIGGNVPAQLIEAGPLGIEGRTVDGLVIATTNMAWLSNAAGLLGMDYLRRFDFRIEPEQAQLYMRPH